MYNEWNWVTVMIFKIEVGAEVYYQKTVLVDQTHTELTFSKKQKKEKRRAVIVIIQVS